MAILSREFRTDEQGIANYEVVDCGLSTGRSARTITASPSHRPSSLHPSSFPFDIQRSKFDIRYSLRSQPPVRFVEDGHFGVGGFFAPPPGSPPAGSWENRLTMSVMSMGNGIAKKGLSPTRAVAASVLIDRSSLTSRQLSPPASQGAQGRRIVPPESICRNVKDWASPPLSQTAR